MLTTRPVLRLSGCGTDPHQSLIYKDLPVLARRVEGFLSVWKERAVQSSCPRATSAATGRRTACCSFSRDCDYARPREPVRSAKTAMLAHPDASRGIAGTGIHIGTYAAHANALNDNHAYF